MELQIQPNRWSCIVTSAAMVFNKPLADVIAKLGHDGSEILWPSLAEPVCRRAFHIEEIQYIAREYGFLLVPYSGRFGYNPSGDPDGYIQVYDFTKWKEVAEKQSGILLGRYTNSPKYHAVAWDSKEGLIYDPCGPIVPGLNSFEVESFYAAFRA